MRAHIYDNKLAITEIKSFNFLFDLPQTVGKSLENEADRIIRHNAF